MYYQNSQTIQAPQYSQPPRKSGVNTEYIATVPGILHILLIVSLYYYFLVLLMIQYEQFYLHVHTGISIPKLGKHRCCS